MSVIAFDGVTLAADKRADFGGLARTVTKIRRIGNLLAGGAGYQCAVLELFRWVEDGRKRDEWPDIQKTEEASSLLVIEPDGAILHYSQSPLPTVIEDRFFAIGSGRDYAMGAMCCGREAAEAVNIASAFDPSCGNGVDVLSLFLMPNEA